MDLYLSFRVESILFRTCKSLSLSLSSGWLCFKSNYNPRVINLGLTREKHDSLVSCNFQTETQNTVFNKRWRGWFLKGKEASHLPNKVVYLLFPIEYNVGRTPCCYFFRYDYYTWSCSDMYTCFLESLFMPIIISVIIFLHHF